MAIRKSVPFNGVVTCANSTERTAFFPSAVEGQFAYLKDTNALTYYDGSTWQTISTPTYPSQTGNAGKFLTTDGTNASWGTIVDLTAYTSFTPTVGTWTLGNGTIASFHRSFGKITHYRGKLTIGSTTSIAASGTLTVTSPTTTSNNGGNNVGQVRWFDTSTGNAYTGVLSLPNNTTTLSLFFDLGTSSILGSWNSSELNLPFTIASGDTVEWNLLYESA
jgi:hypothetical protein